MPGITVQGNTSGWTDTGIHVRQGQWVRITASGWIGFAFGGWHRSPDGVDQNGQGRENASGNHPGPNLVKNSLIAHIGGHTLQAGSNVAFRAPADGNIHLIANDDFRGDNGGSWQVEVNAGVLKQRLLLVTQGTIAPALSTLIETGIARFASLVAGHSDGMVALQIERGGHITEAVDPSDMVPPRDPPDPASSQRVAGFGPAFRKRLERRGVHADNYDGLIRVYEHPAGFPGSGYWTWSFTPGLTRRISYSAIPIGALAREPDGVDGVLLHEYLHQLDYRFEDAGIPGFYDPDGKPAAPPMTNHQFYEHVMRRQMNGTPPPYGRLHGIFGKLG